MSSPLPNFREEFSAKIPALALLTHLGYQFIPPSDCLAMRGRLSSVILPNVLRSVLKHKTHTFMGKEYPLSESAIDKIIQELATPAMNAGLKAANEKIYNALTYGISVTEFIEGKKANPTIQIIDWETPENNQFHFTEEMEVENTHGTGKRIPDLVCFVNGLPWVVIEAKRPDSSHEGKPTVSEGISQNIRNQKNDEIPHLFAYSQLLLSINGNDGLYATCGTPEKFWAKWKEEHITEATYHRLKNTPLSQGKLDLLFNHRPAKVRDEYLSLIAGGDLVLTDQDRLLVSLLRHDRLLEMTRLFTLFDKKAGKIVARYQQVFGIKALIERVTSFDEKGARNGGVIWHTTGSGKSFTMVFLSKALIWLEALKKCRVVVVTDRVDLEDQLARTFSSGGALSDKDKKEAMATTGKRLAEQIGKGNERIIFSIINKFGTAVTLPECYNDSPDIIVLVDEGHRSQNGSNNIFMQQALPKAAYIGFTGTPLLKDDKTENKFGKIIHSYTMQQAVEDKTVTPLLYEERIPELCTNDKAIDAWFDRITDKLSEKQRTDLKKKFSQKGQIYQSEDRLLLIAHDISDHFQNFKREGLKGQLACDSKASAIRYKKLLDEIGKVSSVVAMSPPDTREGHDTVDGESKDLVQNWWKENVGALGFANDEKAYTKHIIEAFGRDDGPDIMIVVDKLLTGFDEPKNTVLYIDKQLRDHNIIQAIARVNRLHQKKLFGYLIDYRGILKELDASIASYQELEERIKGGFDIDDLKGLYARMDTEYKKLPGLYSHLWAIFDGVQNKQDGQALRQALAPKIDTIDGQLTDTNLKKREDFYSALTQFANCLKVALQSATYFDDKSFDDKRDLYKKTLKSMSELRKQVREDAEETVNYDEFAESIRALLDKHIAGVEIQESKGVYLVGNMGKAPKPEEMSDDEARNKKDVITGRVTKIIEQDLADDPYAQEYFSNLLKKAIEQAKEMFDAPVKQYLLFADFEQQVKERNVAGIPTDRFAELDPKIRRHVQAYYGLFLQHVTENPLSEQECFDFSMQIDEIVTAAVAEFSINPSEIENQIRRALLPILFKAVGMDKAKAIITDIIQITRLGVAGHH
ncbi:HsdR family type I site-specific deoxyribonuclease [Vibrio parahaemolyticus]|uniref:Type I restriction enzyme endonuclease subunit n=3 Tax=Vibrio parahaemolyticus TaxID=670 RepID=A0A7Y0SDR2_VIBPH|nr:HsdR family type I site-specific deoxyribonuclease [Vibrio parahaemolyticus]MDF4557982.1 HsdR family type I site-specific deoxyribonuclease [Vibrio parahaemolyticus]MDF5019009.1 HsdR family type I site-specific deoxyribonuclease [Vibrio parahaemolyticus]MDF5098203.1 HsdR family type I site-specific deoxyribonuclease [Vibrio parahaemolyticus]MDF5118830.1 HsdR family type I site-specific deoxyribonuclease [Vibrio parahaemolyticus]MDF5182538.1 HsdR family type I site-specific deoxyribonuclease